MQHYTLELFRKDDSRFVLRVLDGTWQTFPLIEQVAIDALLALAAADYRVNAPDLERRGQDLFNWVDQHSAGKTCSTGSISTVMVGCGGYAPCSSR